MFFVVAALACLATSLLVVRSYRKQAGEAQQSFDWFKSSLGESEGPVS